MIFVGAKGKSAKASPNVGVDDEGSDSDNDSVASGISSNNSNHAAENDVDESTALENFEDSLKECIDGLTQKRYLTMTNV